MADGKIKAVTTFTVTCITDLEIIEGGYRAEGRDPIIQGHTYVFSDAGLPKEIADKLHRMLQCAIIKKLHNTLTIDPDTSIEDVTASKVVVN